MKPTLEAISDAESRTYISFASDDCCVAEVTSSEDEGLIYRVALILDSDNDLHGWCDPRCGWWIGRKTFCKHLYATISKWRALIQDLSKTTTDS